VASTIFPSKPGIVGVYQDLEALPVTVNLTSTDLGAWLETPTVMKAILTGFDLVGEGSVTVNLTLRQKIYVLVVGGERPGQLVLSGLWFPGVCPAATGMTGIDTLLALYEALRVSTTNRTVNVTIARTISLIGVVRKFTARLVDANTGVGEWAMMIDYMPRGVLAASPVVTELVSTVGATALAGVVRS
jgi:hypothetical protein